MKKDALRWLAQELDAWVNDGLIQTEQAAAIRGRYDWTDESTPWARIIFSSIGAVLFGLGVILLFAYNWQEMHKFVKLAVIFGTLIVVHLVGFVFSGKGSRHPILGDGLHLLGTMLFGAGIWLIAQIYHLDEHYPTAFLAWGVGALLLAWALPSIVHGIAASVLLAFWHGSEVLDFATAHHIGVFLLTFGVLPLAWLLRSRSLLLVAGLTVYFAIASSTSWYDVGLMFPVLFAFACSLLALRHLAPHYGDFVHSSGTLRLLGYLVYFPMLYVLTFEDGIGEFLRYGWARLDLWYLNIIAGLALLLWILALVTEVTQHKLWSWWEWLENLMPPLMLILVLVVMFVSPWRFSEGISVSLAWITFVLFNIGLFLHGCLLIVLGSKGGSWALAALGCILVAAIVTTRYLDLFDSLLWRSLAFFVAGAIVFLVANFYKRAKPAAITVAVAP